jgi:hypothetical protein
VAAFTSGLLPDGAEVPRSLLHYAHSIHTCQTLMEMCVSKQFDNLAASLEHKDTHAQAAEVPACHPDNSSEIRPMHRLHANLIHGSLETVLRLL